MGGHQEFNDLQFLFISGRGTKMAVSLVNDVVSYCTERGYPVYTCSLAARGGGHSMPSHIMLFYFERRWMYYLITAG